MRRNIEYLRKTVAYVHEFNIDLLILPYMHPYGPVLSPEVAEALAKKDIRNYMLTTKSGYLHDLILLAKNYGLNIFLPGYLETAGPRRYVSAALIKGYDGEVIRYRKILLTDQEKKLGISPGSKPRFFSIERVSFSVMLDNELLYPELARLNLLFTDFLVVGVPQNASLKQYDSIVRTISRVNKSYTVVPGARVFRSSMLYDAIPSIIVDDRGEIIYKYNEDEQGLIMIPIEKVKKCREKNFREVRRIYNLFKNYLNKRGKRSGSGESDHD